MHISEKISGRCHRFYCYKILIVEQPLFLVDEIHSKGYINAICLVDKNKQVLFGFYD